MVKLYYPCDTGYLRSRGSVTTLTAPDTPTTRATNPTTRRMARSVACCAPVAAP